MIQFGSGRAFPSVWLVLVCASTNSRELLFSYMLFSYVLFSHGKHHDRASADKTGIYAELRQCTHVPSHSGT